MTKLMKIYVTFGQNHVHEYDGHTFDKDCVGIIEAISHRTARLIIFDIFKTKFCTTYDEKCWDEADMKLYPLRGYIPIRWGEDVKKLTLEVTND